MTRPPLRIDTCSLVVVDVQGKLARLMHEKETLFKNVCILIKAAKTLDIPITWCQQVPEALGGTIDEVAELLSDLQPINKASFSCCGDEKFNAAVNALDRRQIILCGIETHVCIYQTAADLVRKGYQVFTIADAVSSRTFENKHIAMGRMAAEDVTIASTEMALFELMKTAEHDRFRKIARLIKK